MAIVIKGASRGNPGQMAAYILAQGKNEFSKVHEVRGTLATDPRGALVEMAAIAVGSRCQDFIYHAQINPEKDDHLTPEQWQTAVDKLEKNLRLEGHQRVVFEHVKDGRQHYHVVWNRVDIETLKAVNMGNNYHVHEATAVELEKAFGLEPLERRPNLEGGRLRDRAPEGWEYRQAEHTGLNPRELKAEVKGLREASSSGKELVAGLAEHGFTVAQGDRRDFVLIDSAGGVHSLGRLAGMKAAELREFMADVDRAKLPTVSEAKTAELDGISFHRTPAAPTGKTAAAIFESFQSTRTPGTFAAALEAKEIYLARVTAADVKRYDEARAAAKEADVQRLPPALHAGEIVAVNKYGDVIKLNERTTGADRAQIARRVAGLKDDPSVMTVSQAQNVSAFVSEKQAAEKEAKREQRRAQARQAEKARRQDKLQREHPLKAFVEDDRATAAPPVIEQKQPEIQKPAIAQQQTPPIAAMLKETAKAAVEPVKAVQKAAPKITGRVANSAAAIVEEVCAILEFFAPSPPPREITPQEMFRSAEAREERKAQLAAEERQRQALENVRHDYESGRGIAREDLHNLGRYQLEAIMAYGIDDGLKQLIKDQERDRGRERER